MCVEHGGFDAAPVLLLSLFSLRCREPGGRQQKWTQCSRGKCLAIGPCPKRQVSQCYVTAG